MASLIGKIDLEVEKRTNDYSQEAANKALSEELVKKTKRWINIYLKNVDKFSIGLRKIKFSREQKV